MLFFDTISVNKFFPKGRVKNNDVVISWHRLTSDDANF